MLTGLYNGQAFALEPLRLNLRVHYTTFPSPEIVTYIIM